MTKRRKVAGAWKSVEYVIRPASWWDDESRRMKRIRERFAKGEPVRETFWHRIKRLFRRC